MRRLVRAGVAVAALAAALFLIGLRVRWRGAGRPAIAAAFASYAAVPAAAGALLALLARVRVLAGVPLLALLAALGLQAPLVVPDRGARGEPTLTVLSANLLLGGGEAADVLAAIRRERVDVLAGHELTVVVAHLAQPLGASTGGAGSTRPSVPSWAGCPGR